MPVIKAVLLGLQFGLLVLIVNLAVLPMLIFGIGAIAHLIANAYLLSREYFEMAAMRHMPVEDAKLDSLPVFDEPFLLAVPTGHRLARANRVTPADLSGEHLLLLKDGHCLRD
mgnify:CR=1 FL=1